MNTTTNSQQTQYALMTGEDLYAQDNTQRAELIEGKLRVMSPTEFIRGRVEFNIGSLLKKFVSEQQLKFNSFLDIERKLIMEVLSPNDSWLEVNTKFEEYFGLGVKHLWLANPVHCALDIYSSPTENQVLQNEDLIKDETILPGFACPVGDFFA